MSNPLTALSEQLNTLESWEPENGAELTAVIETLPEVLIDLSNALHELGETVEEKVGDNSAAVIHLDDLAGAAAAMKDLAEDMVGVYQEETKFWRDE